MYSTMTFQHLSMVKALEMLSMYTGSKVVELSHVHIDKLSADQFRHLIPKILEVVREFGVVIKVLHMPTYISAVDSVDEYENALYQAYEWLMAVHSLEVDVAVMHTLYISRHVAMNSVEWFTKNLELNRIFISRLSKKVRELGITLAIENRVERWLVGNSAMDLIELVHESDGVGICFDLGHAHASGYNLVEFHEAIRDYIVAYHIHDNDGFRDQHLLPFLGSIDWDAIRSVIKRDKPMVFEVACSGDRRCINYVELIDIVYKRLFSDELTAS